jgi:hypothetical protein
MGPFSVLYAPKLAVVEKRNGSGPGEAETVFLGNYAGAARHNADLGQRPADANKFRVNVGMICADRERPGDCTARINANAASGPFTLGGVVRFSGLF